MSTEAIFPEETVEIVKSHVREVEDFPARGVLFRDITPLIADGEAFAALIQMLADRYRGKCDAIAGLESRGFILGAPLAHELGIGMLTIRKAGRLPGPVVGVNYDLEYGSARMELQPFTVEDGMRVLVIDDVLATGGTAGAAFHLIEKAGAKPAGLCVLLELSELGGRGYLGEHYDYPVESVIAY
ncbi:adenine phosphoribosyltransferase [Trueperella pecoris]|uniref:Adenine phosphoribosyltransferase n=1 Tax=Trueperella pecoris TaxID=2733571 RepID=A0A7M1R338_9ACTO|nr:adenine phosphoribosyltransferase [Trueperella pecoris]QOR48563.1 adenine phosphoribosyltransferase [Trueperella pecoris]